MFLLKLHKEICKSAQFGQNNLRKVDKNGTKHWFEFGLALKKLNTLMKTK